MRLPELSAAVKRADIASLPLLQACQALADLPAAKKYNVTPAFLYRAAHYALPKDQADKLLTKAGVRGHLRLADLAYLARHDLVLRQLVAAIICLVDRGE